MLAKEFRVIVKKCKKGRSLVKDNSNQRVDSEPSKSFFHFCFAGWNVKEFFYLENFVCYRRI